MIYHFIEDLYAYKGLYAMEDAGREKELFIIYTRSGPANLKAYDKIGTAIKNAENIGKTFFGTLWINREIYNKKSGRLACGNGNREQVWKKEFNGNA